MRLPSYLGVAIGANAAILQVVMLCSSDLCHFRSLIVWSTLERTGRDGNVRGAIGTY